MDRRWERAMAQMVDFVAAHGRFPKRHSGDRAEEYLANWLYKQRTQHRRGALSAERLKQLQALGNWRLPPGTGTAEATYSARLAEVAAFVASHGHLPARRHTSGPQEWSLALFIHRQRRRAQAGTLEPGRADRLDQAAPGWNEKPLPVAEQQRAAARARLDPHGPVILAGLASGRSPAAMAAVTGVPHQLIFGAGRRDEKWARQLEAALFEGRNPTLDHGSWAAYRQGCRCKDCRELVAGYRQPSRPRATGYTKQADRDR